MKDHNQILAEKIVKYMEGSLVGHQEDITIINALITQHFADQWKANLPEGLEEMATLHRKTCNIPPHAGPFEEVLDKWGDMIDRYMVSFARKAIAEKMPSEEIKKIRKMENDYSDVYIKQELRKIRKILFEGRMRDTIEAGAEIENLIKYITDKMKGG